MTVASRPRARSARGALWTVVAGGFLLGLAALASSCGRSGGRVLVLAFDGLDPSTVDLLLSEGELPNLARIRREGAYGPLRSRRPLLSPVVWTTIATGKTADVHGISHFVAEDPETGESLPVTSDLRRVRALWNIASDAGRRVAVVGWWATWPPEPVRGVVVSDRTAYHFLFDEGFERGLRGDEIHPPELAGAVAARLRRPGDLDPGELERFVSGEIAPAPAGGELRFDDDLSHLRWGLATALSYRDVGLHLWREERPDLELVYFEVTDSAAHLFGHLFRHEDLAGDLAAQEARFGGTVEEVYRFADEIVGRYLEAMDARTTLLVLSDHGFELGALHDDPSRARDLRRVSERFHRDDGVLYLYGAGVRRGVRLDRPTILDVAPTVLALVGLPPASDMPGRVLVEGLRMEGGPERIATYEADRADPPAVAGRDREADAAALRRLRALGYLEGGDRELRAASPGAAGRRNLAAIYFEAGRLEEALALYAELVAESPEDAGLRTSLAGTLGALGRDEEALAEIDRALELDPLNVEAYHNRAVLQERGGRRAEAIESYRTALRYAPDYEPSIRALRRLGGARAPAPPHSSAEKEALALAARAAEAARRGDYEAAWEDLESARERAPDLAVIYQYRANVAYLSGDVAAAVAALERGLELEPDNELFKANLERLRGESD